MTLLAGYPLRLVNGEEASILDGATVPPTALDGSTPDGDALINGSYKSLIITADNSNPVDVAVELL